MRIEHGEAADAARLLALFDDAVAWLVARGQTGQWGSEPFSARPAQVERTHAWAAGGGLWFAVDGGADAGACRSCRRRTCGSASGASGPSTSTAGRARCWSADL